jgi:outer membrane autotransporter protein
VLGNNASASDRLVLNGASAVASGHTRVQIANLGGLGALTSGNGIEVVTALNGASTAPNAFALVGGHVDAGAYEYRLYDGDASGTGENWYLRSATTPLAPAAPTTAAGEQPVKPVSSGPAASSLAVPTYRAEVPLLAGLPAQWRQANLAMLGNLHQRVGDEEVLPDPRSGSPRSAWARLVGSEIDVRQTGAVAPHSQGRLRGLQAGIDLYAGASWRAGIYVGRLEGDIEVSGFARGVTGRVGHNSLRSDYLGGYATYHGADGFYADTVVQAGRHRHTVEPLVNSPAAGKGNSALASIEVGQSFRIGERWKLEPQLQLAYQRLRLDDMAIAGAQVQQQLNSGWTARAGLRLKGEYPTPAGTVQPYVRINVYRASAGEDVVRFAGPAAITDIASSTGYTTAELAGGLTMTLNPVASVYGEIGKLWALGGDSRVRSGLQGSAGVRVRW